MKILIFIPFIVISCSNLFAQKVVPLSIEQPPEFGFSISKQDTTIVSGSSVTLGTDLKVFGGSEQYQYYWTPSTTLDDSTVANPLASPVDTTIYLLTVSDNYGCSFSINYTVNVKESMVNNEILSFDKNLNVVLFPNPNSGLFKVRLFGASSGIITISVCDILGKVVKKKIIRNFSGDLTETFHVTLVNGVYSLVVESDTENLTRQFIIN